MVLTEQQLTQLIRETVARVVTEGKDEYAYHEKQHQPSEEEHAEWIKRKAAAKKRYYDSQKKDDDKPIDHYEYKHGKGDFPVVKEDLFVPFAKEASDDVIRVTPSNFYNIIKSIRNGEFDELLKTAQGGITSEWAMNHIDVSAHNMDTATDLYYSIIDVLKERLDDKENTVRLSESQLREVIKDSVTKVLKENFDFDDLPDFEDVPDADSLKDDELIEMLLNWAKEIQAEKNYYATNRWLALYNKIADRVDEKSPIYRAYRYIKSMAQFGRYGAHRMSWPGDRSNKNAVGLNETTLDYDMDNFSGRWGRGPRYDILVDGEVYYSDVPDESVDRLCADLERQGYENIQVQEL